MIAWSLLTLAFGYIIGMEPHLRPYRAWLANRWSFFRGMVSCIPCAAAWPGAFVEAVFQTHAFFPDWLEPLVPWYAVSGVSPVLGFFAGMALGYLVEALSPMTAAVFEERRRDYRLAA